MEPVPTPRPVRRVRRWRRLVLAVKERSTLYRWAQKRPPAAPRRWPLRCRIVLACAEGLSQQPGRPPAWRGPVHGDQAASAVLWPTGWTDWSMSQGRVRPARSPSTQVEQLLVMTLETHPDRCRRLVDTGCLAGRSAARPSRRSAASGGRSGSSRGRSTPSSRRPTRCSSTRAATSSGCTWSHPSRPGAVGGRKDPGASVGPDRGRCCRCCQATSQRVHPRLRPPRGHRPVRGLGRRHRRSSPQLTARHRAVEFKRFLDRIDPQPSPQAWRRTWSRQLLHRQGPCYRALAAGPSARAAAFTRPASSEPSVRPR